MNNLNYPFRGSENITNNYSQCGQDLFVLGILNGKQNGFYLDIGAGPYAYNSNTYLLETQFGWKGVALDLDIQCYQEHKQNRNHHIELVDGSTVNYLHLLERGNFKDTLIDYVSLDLDGQSSLDALYNLPWDTHKISTLTYEHDAYIFGDVFKEKSREFLFSKGMTLLVSNVLADEGMDFEDWWIDPTTVDAEIASRMEASGGYRKLWRHYIFKN